MNTLRRPTLRDFNRFVSKIFYRFTQPSEEKFQTNLKKYQTLYRTYKSERIDYSDFTIPDWRKAEEEMDTYFLTNFDSKFLNYPLILSNMFMDHGGKQQENEVQFLEGELPKDLLRNYLKEPSLGAPTITNWKYHTSHNTTHHLTHLLKFKKETGKLNSKNILEWGGGYGNLCRIYLDLVPDSTYTIIDIPVFSFIQTIYLSTIFGNDRINMILEPGNKIQEGKINIVPLNKTVLDSLDIKPDLFISTWALSESSSYAINYVSEHKFFGAKQLLLAHQETNGSIPYADEVAKSLSGFNIVYHQKIPLLKNNYYLFAKKSI